MFGVSFQSLAINKLWMGLQLQVNMDLSKAFSGLQHDFMKAKRCAHSFKINVLQLIYSYFSKKSELEQE